MAVLNQEIYHIIVLFISFGPIYQSMTMSSCLCALLSEMDGYKKLRLINGPRDPTLLSLSCSGSSWIWAMFDRR